MINFDNWLMANGLALILKKTVAINFSTKLYETHVVLRINNKNMSFVEFTKYLGVFIDIKLTFTKYMETVRKKL